MNKVKLIKALTRTLLILAYSHFIILIFLSVITQNFHYLNVFSVLDLQEFIPGIDTGMWSEIASAVIFVTLFAVSFLKWKR